MAWDDLDELLYDSKKGTRNGGSSSRWVVLILALFLLLFGGGIIWSQIERANRESPNIAKANSLAETNHALVISDNGHSPPEPAAKSYLSEKEAKYLQDVEHFGGFVLGDLAFPQIVKALKLNSKPDLLDFFAPGFSGSLFSDDKGEVVSLPFGEFSAWNERTNSKVTLNREKFVAALLRFRADFAEIQIAGLKVIRMSPIYHGDLEGEWEGSCKLYLGGRTHSGEIVKRNMLFRCKITEITSATPNLRNWFAGCEIVSAELAKGPDFLMHDITSQTGISVDRLRDNWKHPSETGNPYLTGGVYLCDYNSDGHADILLTDIDDGVSFYRGEGKAKFTEVSEILGHNLQARSAAFADLDGDGDEDLILENRVFENEKGVRFREKLPGEQSLTLTPDFAGYAIADYDRDGDLDLYAVGGFDGTGEESMKWIGENRVSRNQLFRNLGNWRFEDVTESAGVRGSGSPAFAAGWFDANGDNWPDVMSACYGTNDYFINQKDGTFVQGALPEGYGGFSMGLAISDIDNDGFGDPFVGNMYSKAGERVMGNLRSGLYPPEIEALMKDFVTGDELFRNRGDGSFWRIGEKSGINDVGWAYGVGYGDLDGDGYPDAYSPVGFQSVSPNKPDG